ncbi:uncharacterized protein TM35_000361780 [Trypanosoma theileri]|uniref:Uncharacterized protein n=1 Tax=Trypanosoma theileri TaxID=67003 RepID=A0A1X0NLB2_9TRYP|nr:uncharacterized protein TM35_000361780 [Trypanosoma theileri]ORC85318.1 hypothetical protein TM35_000361780 [Trypanosoma theileri]
MDHDKEKNENKEVLIETPTEQKEGISPSDTPAESIQLNVSLPPVNISSSSPNEDERLWELVDPPETSLDVVKSTRQEIQRVLSILSNHERLQEINTKKQDGLSQSQIILELQLVELNGKLQKEVEQLKGDLEIQIKERKHNQEAFEKRQHELESSVKKLKKKLETEVAQRKVDQETHKRQENKLESQINDLKKELDAESLQRKTAEEALENLRKDLEAQMRELNKKFDAQPIIRF